MEKEMGFEGKSRCCLSLELMRYITKQIVQVNSALKRSFCSKLSSQASFVSFFKIFPKVAMKIVKKIFGLEEYLCQKHPSHRPHSFEIQAEACPKGKKYSKKR